MATSIKKVIVDPLSENNPVTIQILGICSSLAVTTQVDKAFVMSVGLTVVWKTWARWPISSKPPRPWTWESRAGSTACPSC